MSLRRVLLIVCCLPLAELGCSETKNPPLIGTGGSGTGSLPGSGGAGSGGRRGRPVDDLGGDLNIGIGDQTGGSSTSTGGSAMKPSPGTLSVCDVDGGRSIGRAGGNLTLDNFDSLENGYSGNGLQGGWFVYDDGSDGTQEPPSNEVKPIPGGLSGSEGVLRVRGEGFTSWGSGLGTVFASDGSGACAFDASAYTGITFWAKGLIEEDDSIEPWDPGILRVMLVEKDVVPLPEGNCDDALGDCWSSHRVRITLGECWKRYSFRFSEFEPDAWGFPGGTLDLTELYELAFELGRGNRYDIWLDDIRFFIGTPPNNAEICDMGPGGAGNL